MKIYCDMEFTGLRQNTELISIGIVADDGKVFYAESTDYQMSNASERDQEWLNENVIPYLVFNDNEISYMTGSFESDLLHVDKQMEYMVKCDMTHIRELLTKWLNQYDEITFIGDVPAYDWILFCSTLGDSAKDIPKHISYVPIDIATLMYILEIDPTNTTRHKFVDVSDIDKGRVWQKQHNALYDAIVIKKIYNKLIDRFHILKKSDKMLDLLISYRNKSDKENHIIIPESDLKALNDIVLLKNKSDSGGE